MARKSSKPTEIAEDSSTEGETVEGESETSSEESAPAQAEAEDTTPGRKGKDRLSAILASELFAKIQKKHGDSILMRASDFKVQQRPRISTGIFPLDYALGGGFPGGLVSTVYGDKSASKTTVLLKTISCAQKMCSICYKYLVDESWGCQCKKYREFVVAYLDVEGTLDIGWARDLGVDPEKMIISIPEYAEQTLDIAEALVRSTECDILVLDSLAFLVPSKEIEESNEKAMMGVQSQVIGRGIRKLTSAANTVGNATGRRPTIFFTNQIRMAIGVMFGCFRGDTGVVFANGFQYPIAEVVNNRMIGPVLSWDGEKIVERNIINWYNNGRIEDYTPWLSFSTEGTGGNAHGFTCTPNHTLITGDGKEVKAGDVKVGDYLLSWYEERMSSSERQVMIGSLFGDGSISPRNKFRLANSEQPEYLEWKKSLLKSFTFNKMKAKTNIWETPADPEFQNLRRKFYGQSTRGRRNYRTIPLDLLKEATPLTLAVWYADDGNYRNDHRDASISVKRLTDDHAENIAEAISERFPGIRYSRSSRSLRIPVDTFEMFSAVIASYLPPCMAYKLLPEHRHFAVASSDMIQDPFPRRTTTAVKVFSIKEASKNKRKVKFDLQIEGDSFYLVGGNQGVIVHNSPEVLPGGRAPGYASATETKLRQGKTEVDEITQKPIHVDINFKIEKNKTSGAKMEGSFRLHTSNSSVKKKGDITDEDQILDWGEKTGMIQRNGGYQCNGETFRLKGDLEKRLAKDPEFKMKLWRDVMPVLLAS